MRDVLIIGCGDIGRRVARIWKDRGARVTGVVQSAISAAEIRAAGITALRLDLDGELAAAEIPAAGTLLYYFAPPPPQGSIDSRLQNFLSALKTEVRPHRFVLIGTTGVYGDHRGKRVSEKTPPNPGSDRARRRLHAENCLRAWSQETGVPVVILRVGGIYGPARLPIDRLKKRTPVIAPDQAPITNRIHEDDLAAICVTAAVRGRPGAVYNVCDGQGGNMTEYFFAVADAYGIERPPVIEREQAGRELSAGMLSYLRESRLVDNSLLLRELGITLRYPDLQSGLAACLRDRPA